MPASPAALPHFLTSLVGRERDLAEVASLVRSARLVTLSGAGGSGKTRLAAAVASNLRGTLAEYVAWVDLAPLMDPALLAEHVASVVGVREEAGRAVLDGIAEAICTRSALLVLDCCEHLVGACAALAGVLLRACPALRVLATSRQPLGIAGEKVWIVPPLELPAVDDAASAASSSAVQLFVQRAQDALASFELTEGNRAAVAHICRRVDGLPLAIELAAARVKVLPPEQLARRLDDAFSILASGDRTVLPRHRTLRALIDWSYGLLPKDERLLLERLSIFAGGFSLDSAERVVGHAPLVGAEVLDRLAALVDKSLVTAREREGEARYALLETVREYASERLRERADPPSGAGTACNEASLAERHARHYLDVAECAAALLHHESQLVWLARLDAEHDNLRAALRWTLAEGRCELAMRLCTALHEYWRMRGHLREALRWMDEALESSAIADGLRSRVLVGSGVLARRLGVQDIFRARVMEGEALARKLSERRALALALTQRGVHLRDLGDVAGARALIDEALATWRECGEVWGLAAALAARSSIAYAERDLPLAWALRQEALDVSRAAGDREGQAVALIGLGELARGEMDVPAAREYYARAMELFRALGDTWHVAALLHNQGWLAAETGDANEASRLFVATLTLFGGDRSLFLAPALLGLARVLADTGTPEFAGEVFGCATSLLHRQNVRPAGADARSIERTRTAIESALGTEAFARAAERGSRQAPLEVFRQAVERIERHTTAETSPPAGAAATAALPDRRPAPRQSVPRLARVLSLTTLGALEMHADGVVIESDAFGSRKARELLVYLASRPEGYTREQVGLAFWPDASAAEVKNRFHVTLHRVRRAVTHDDWIVLADDRYRIAPAVHVELDAARFESEVVAALRAARAGACEPDRLAAALALYRGDFLESEGAGDWHLETRERLRRLWIDGQFALGDALMLAGRFEDAAATWRALLAREPLHEPACRRLMVCAARLGERAEALRQYERLVLLLRETFGAAPDAETSALYDRLQRGAVMS